MDGVAYLVSEVYEPDRIGQRIAKTKKREVMITTNDITRTEFASAGKIGLRPDIMIETPSVNYLGEKLVEIAGIMYAVYRSYDRGEMVELYLQKQVGV